jgi:hypothetical protein
MRREIANLYPPSLPVTKREAFAQGSESDEAIQLALRLNGLLRWRSQ